MLPFDRLNSAQLPPCPDRLALSLGNMRLRLAETAQDHAAVRILRGQRFLRGAGTKTDQDRFDPLSLHLMVEDAVSDAALLATTRLRLLSGQAAYTGSYTGQFYDLRPLARAFPQGLEIGRLCSLAALPSNADVLRVLLAGITRLALTGQAQLLFGCASFHGADVARHALALAWLGARHVGPEGLRPPQRSAQVVRLDDLGPAQADGARGVPPLLRLYLGMGGWVSDHAVIDRELDTLHVLVAVPVAAIPPARLHRLEDMAGLPLRLPLG